MKNLVWGGCLDTEGLQAPDGIELSCQVSTGEFHRTLLSRSRRAAEGLEWQPIDGPRARYLQPRTSAEVAFSGCGGPVDEPHMTGSGSMAPTALAAHAHLPRTVGRLAPARRSLGSRRT